MSSPERLAFPFQVHLDASYGSVAGSSGIPPDNKESRMRKMKNRMSGVAAVVAAAAASSPCLADHVIDTYPFWDNNITNGWLATAQSFIAPTHNILSRFTFGFETGGLPLSFDVFQWDENSGPIGGSLFHTNINSVAGDNTVSGINLALNAGTMYAVIVDFQGFSGPSMHWMTNTTGNPTGDASWWDGSSWNFLNSGWSTKFRAEFSEVPAPGALALLGAAGLATRGRRRRV